MDKFNPSVDSEELARAPLKARKAPNQPSLTTIRSRQLRAMLQEAAMAADRGIRAYVAAPDGGPIAVFEPVGSGASAGNTKDGGNADSAQKVQVMQFPNKRQPKDW